ncbi:putative iron-regulated protein [Desulfobaculum xiamenense]|uniref:Putative iron-regulated protein n=1 Tax=Desulfobaculum xiamenense TaxID=995050 RepID=A0A846QN72_9BACT|nr:ChaN family lipoprotein [Desulfobaculum xiamenense]NJB68637.1 putative iron-regulated protein [Desulfobaculum xiamenense]
MGLVPSRLAKALIRAGAAAVVAVALCACARTPADPVGGVVRPAVVAPAMPGEMFDATGGPLSMRDFVRRALDVRYVLLGEGHSSACDHAVQAEAIAAIDSAAVAAGRPRPVVGLEMVPRERQDVLDRFNAGELSVEELPTALDWPNVWGHPYALYEPVIRAARERGLPLVALNVPLRLVRAVSTSGLSGLDAGDRALLPDVIIPPREDQRESLREEFERHRMIMNRKGATDDALERFMTSQSLWDSAMAGAAVEAYRAWSRPVVVVVGSGHVEYGWGLGYRLSVLDPGAKALSVVPWRGVEPVDLAQADVFFYCALTHASRLGFSVELQAGGAAITAVEPDSRAAKAGLAVGDVITAAQGMTVVELWVLHKAAIRASREDDGRLRLDVRRDGASREIIIQLTRSRPGGGSAPEADGPK